MATYKEPEVSFLILDYEKPMETTNLILSLRTHVKFPFKIIYCHNGQSKYAHEFMRTGQVDQLIITKNNNGLGIGTRDLFAACFSDYAIYVQNDQFLARPFSQDEFDHLKNLLSSSVKSISLAGAPCGKNVYSERAHLIEPRFYKELESYGLPFGGAGPYHDSDWREGFMQKYYAHHNFVHLTEVNALFQDDGRTAVRQNPDGSKWKHFPDTKQLWLLKGPVKEKFVYPKFTDAEWDEVLKTQSWPDGKIPANEVKDSFHVWN